MPVSQALNQPPLPDSPDPGDTRALILHTAAALFLQHGYAAVSMNQIVEEVSKVRKLSKPAIYYHFEDKRALFLAVLLDMVERGGRAIAAAGETEGDLATRVAALARAFPSGQGFFQFRASLNTLDQETLDQFSRARHEHFHTPLVAAFERFAARGELRPGVAPATAAMALMGITHTLAISGMMGKIDGDVATMAADLLLHGIAAPAGDGRDRLSRTPTGEQSHSR